MCFQASVTHGENGADRHDEMHGTTPPVGSGSIAIALPTYLRLLEERTHKLLSARIAELLFNHLPE